MNKDDNAEQFDIRVVHNHMRDGRLDRKTYEKWLASLPDDAEFGVETEVRFVPSEEKNDSVANPSEN